MPQQTWQKSTFSDGAGDNCVELAASPDAIHLRESDAPGAIVSTDRTALSALIIAIKAGEFDHLAQ
jgi:hypothetical protein